MDSRAQPPPQSQPPLQAAPNMMMGPAHYPTIPFPTAPGSASPMINPNSAAPVRFPFTQPLNSGNTTGGAAYEGSPSAAADAAAKRKRGRPRKYGPEGTIALGLTPSPMPPPLSPRASQGGNSGGPSSEPQVKKVRGRPPGSGKKQLDALGAGGVGFTPHVILVDIGEDVASKITAFSQQGPRAVCILSATGAVSNVSLRQSQLTSTTVSHEGRFEIISLSGSVILSENNGSHSRSTNLRVSLAGSDGRVVGGGVVSLVAATPVQVIVGSFISEIKKSASVPPPQMMSFNSPATAPSPPSQRVSSESSDENGNNLNRDPLLYNSPSQQPIHNIQMYQLWANQNQQ